MTKFCMVAPNTCGTPVWNFLYAGFLAPRILRRLLNFWKICARLTSSITLCCFDAAQQRQVSPQKSIKSVTVVNEIFDIVHQKVERRKNLLCSTLVSDTDFI